MKLVELSPWQQYLQKRRYYVEYDDSDKQAKS